MSDLPEIPETPETNEDATPNAKGDKRRKWVKGALSAAFHMASGAALTTIVKCALGAAVLGISSPVATVALTAVTVAALTTSATYLYEKMKAAPDQRDQVKFSWKKFAFRTAASAVGGAIVMSFGDSICAAAEKGCDFIKDLFTPDAATSDLSHAAAPVPVVDCPDAVEQAKTVLANVQDKTPCLEQALKDALNGDAQGMKDLGFFLLNGLDGAPKDPALAVELLQKAAEAGNHQAMVDLAYLQYHGLAGVPADPDAAIEAMKNIGTDQAKDFVSQWTGQAAEQGAQAAQDTVTETIRTVEVEVSTGEAAPVETPVDAPADAPVSEGPVESAPVESAPVESATCQFSMAANGVDTVIDCEVASDTMKPGDYINIHNGGETVQAVMEQSDKAMPTDDFLNNYAVPSALKAFAPA